MLANVISYSDPMKIRIYKLEEITLLTCDSINHLDLVTWITRLRQTGKGRQQQRCLCQHLQQ